MRLAAFIIALLLLGGAVDPTRGWLIALVVLTGFAALRPRFWNWLDWRPAVDLRLAAFVLAVLLLAGAVDASKEWLIALSVVTGLAAFTSSGARAGWCGFGGHRSHRWDRDDWEGRADRWAAKADRKWDRWERRIDRRTERTQRWGDDWS